MDGTYVTKNYMTDGGNELVIGGKLTVLEDAEVTGLPGGADYKLPAATAKALGGVKQAAAVADAADTDAATLQSTLNRLLAALRTSGVLAKS